MGMPKVLATVDSAPKGAWDTLIETGSFPNSRSDAASFIQGVASINVAQERVQLSQHRPPAWPSASQSVFVVFPGVGSLPRVQNVRKNIQILQSTLGQNFRCFLRIYVDGAATNPQYDASLFAPCHVDYNMELKLFASVKDISVPAHDVSSVFFLNDDMTLSNDTLTMLSAVLSKADVDVVSTSYRDAWCANMKPRSGLVAHESHFVEFNAVLFKTRSFRCLQQSVDPVLNPLGYGYDNMFATLCGVRMAVCDACTVSHLSQKEHRLGGPNSKDTYNHQAAVDQMRTWYHSLKNKTGFDSCSSDYSSAPLALSEKDI